MMEHFYIPLFETNRKIRVYLPDDYATSERRYPVLYIHDGQNVFDAEEAIGGVSLDLHEYLDEQEIPLIVVAIDQNSTGVERFHEYCPWPIGDFSKEMVGGNLKAGGKGKEYVDFLVQQLKPLIDSRYRTVPMQSYIAGISLGGLISVYAACAFPHVFTRVAGISTAFFRNQEEIEAFAQASHLSSMEKIYLDCGTSESPEDPKVSAAFLHTNQRMVDLLKAKVDHVHFETVEGARHHYEEFKKRVPAFLNHLLR